MHSDKVWKAGLTVQECRCSKCNKLLGKIEGRAEIVCTRCGVLNAFNVPDEFHKAIDEQDDTKKNPIDSKSCSECEHLQNDHGTLRCQLFDGAIVKNDNEKNCIDSVQMLQQTYAMLKQIL